MSPETVNILSQLGVGMMLFAAIYLVIHVGIQVVQNYRNRPIKAVIGEYHDWDGVPGPDLPEEKFVQPISQHALFLKARYLAIEMGAKGQEYMTIDHVYSKLEEIGEPTYLEAAAGNIFRNHVFQKTGLFARSRRPSNRGRSVQIWRYVGASINEAVDLSNFDLSKIENKTEDSNG